MSTALFLGANATGAAAASIGDHSDAAAALPLTLTGSVASVAVLIGLVGLIVGLTRRGRRELAAKRAAAQQNNTSG